MAAEILVYSHPAKDRCFAALEPPAQRTSMRGGCLLWGFPGRMQLVWPSPPSSRVLRARAGTCPPEVCLLMYWRKQILLLTGEQWAHLMESAYFIKKLSWVLLYCHGSGLVLFLSPFVLPLKLQEQACLPGHSLRVAPFQGSIAWLGRAVLCWASGPCVMYTQLGDASSWISVGGSFRGSESFSGGRVPLVIQGN